MRCPYECRNKGWLLHETFYKFANRQTVSETITFYSIDMKKFILLITAAGLLFMVNAASAQSKKELMKENENLRKENYLMQAKIDSAEAAGIYCRKSLMKKHWKRKSLH